MNHVSNLGGVSLCFNGVLTSTPGVGEFVTFVTHLTKKAPQRRIKTGNAPGFVDRVTRVGAMASNKPIHASVKIGIVETMFIKNLVILGSCQ